MGMTKHGHDEKMSMTKHGHDKTWAINTKIFPDVIIMLGMLMLDMSRQINASLLCRDRLLPMLEGPNDITTDCSPASAILHRMQVPQCIFCKTVQSVGACRQST